MPSCAWWLNGSVDVHESCSGSQGGIPQQSSSVTLRHNFVASLVAVVRTDRLRHVSSCHRVKQGPAADPPTQMDRTTDGHAYTRIETGVDAPDRHYSVMRRDGMARPDTLTHAEASWPGTTASLKHTIFSGAKPTPAVSHAPSGKAPFLRSISCCTGLCPPQLTRPCGRSASVACKRLETPQESRS